MNTIKDMELKENTKLHRNSLNNQLYEGKKKRSQIPKNKNRI